jgi:hypothetical protein
MTPRQLDKLPIDFAAGDFQPRNAWRGAPVGTGHATRIEKQNPTPSFIAWHMRMPVQKNIDIIRDMIRRYMLQAEL